MYINAYLGGLIGTFIEWGFLMAFLFNLAMSINKNDRRPLILAFIMMLSYFLSGVLELSSFHYLNWLYYDLVTIIIIVAWLKLKQHPIFYAAIYILIGLLLNSFLMLSIYIDIFVYDNTTPWLLWTIYSLGVNSIDIMMILALLLNKDFLKLGALVSHIKAKAC
ncbi:hypothetical protein LY624_13790 [Pseudoalteromonas sp. N1230-9]|jgi:hypothetical protein|uniref:hypothetical protein n=1 Tax=Pseudoalteromonas sp. N1230-9 TaxID=2907156 RepID=UPI002B3024D6|nr:hypothetical protein LY624_13790 [Pseudoalteromonas sp. N1230-9]